MFSANNSRPNSKGGRDRQQPFVPFSHPTDRERADIGLEIKVLVGIAERRERLRQIEFLLGDEILVLDDACRKRDARHFGDAFRPESGAVDEVVATDRPMIGRDAHDFPAIFKDAGDGRALLQRCAILARGGREGLRESIRIDVTVGRNERRPDHALRIDIGEQIDGLICRERVTLEAEALGQGHRAANFAPPVRRGCKP